MPRTFGSSFVLAAVLSAGTAAAAEAPKPSDAKRVCKTERSISSRIVRRVCKTEAEWRTDSLEARNKLKLGAKSQTTEAFKSSAGQ